MAKIVELDPSVASTRSFKRWLQELAETEYTFNLLNRLRQENMALQQQQAQAQQQTQVITVPDIGYLREIAKQLKDLPEEERSIVMSLIAGMNRPPAVQQQTVQPVIDPSLLILLLLLRREERSGGDGGALAAAINGLTSVVREAISGGGKNDVGSILSGIASILDKISKEGGGGGNGIVEEIARKAIDGLISAARNPEEDFLEKLEFIRKLQESGILPDPELMFRWNVEKYKIDKEHEYRMEKLRAEREQAEKITEFLSDALDVADKLLGGGGEEEEEEGEAKKVFKLKCPACNGVVEVVRGAERVKCPSCGKNLVVKWKRAGR